MGRKINQGRIRLQKFRCENNLRVSTFIFFFLIIFVIGVLEWRKVLNKAITELRLAFRSSDFWFRVFFPSYSTCAWTITAGFAQV